MADKIHFKRALAPLPPIRTRLSWIKRRARCVALFYQVNRREAVENAALDWHQFNPTATH
ncbi:MAG: hypothetical protein ACYC4S_09690 [Rhodoferax sp.]